MAGSVLRPSRQQERAGWPIIDVVDRRRDDPARGGLFSPVLVERLRAAERAVCVLNRKGRSRLLACVRCGAIAACDRCGAAMAQDDDGQLVCRRGDSTRPLVCQECGSVNFKNLRHGIARAREELEALVRRPVVEVSAATAGSELPDASVYVGTEAVLHQVHRADVVAFLDFDQELLAPRYRAAEEALTLLARAARIVGDRAGRGRVVVQTRMPRNEAVQAALQANPALLSDAERTRRTELGYPPFAALAEVSGQGGPQFVDALGRPLGVEVLGPRDGRWLLRAANHQTLCDALAATPRPKARLRLAVDPPRV
jgi:primosomal protein N' (replication factor Y) (superfamily II helicase)